MKVTEGLVQPFGWGLAYPDWIDVASPSAGSNASVIVDGAWNARILAARATLTTDSNAANRVVTLDYLDARGNVRASSGSAAVVVASTTGQVINWLTGVGGGSSAANSPTWCSLLSIFLYPAMQVRFTVVGIQAGDQLSGLSLWVEKFPTGPTGYPTGANRREYLPEPGIG